LVDDGLQDKLLHHLSRLCLLPCPSSSEFLSELKQLGVMAKNYLGSSMV